ncbi:MAG: serine/threonine protein kinase [Labilithrix sp.]|nr:serine/threonine protein kinase [Labilithrix sp.]
MTKLLATDGEGERLDRFELIAELASGGMATVFLARLSGVAGFQRLVAIKRLHPHLAREPEFVEMFLDEARLAARIHHPNVVPIQEVGESNQGYYLVMDYVEGDTLARILARAAKAASKVPYGVTIRILLDTLAGLHAAHELKDDHGEPLHIVHRDVSPQNILVGVDGVARVVDFGVARAASRLSTTRSGQLKGKLAYMAPEQARGASTVDRRADIFSCGIVLWEALAIKRLFKGDGEADTLNRVLYDTIPPPTTVRPDIPRSLEAVCMKALSRDIDKRFATAQDFADELETAARALSCVGSVRDVATCLEQVIGADLSQQRDAVRAWLARSEPSASNPPRSKPMLDSIVTRVDGGSKSEPSSRSRSGTGPRTPERLSRPPIDRGAVTAPAPPDAVLASPADKVSSVSSVVSMPLEGSGAGPVSTTSPPQSRVARVALALVAAVVLLGVGAWGARRFGTDTPRPAPAATGAPASAPLPRVAPEPSSGAPSSAASEAAAPAASAEAPRPEASASAKAAPVKPFRPALKPAGSARPSTTAEDLRNPYR